MADETPVPESPRPPDEASRAAGRRSFLRAAALGGGMAGLGGVVGYAVNRLTRHAPAPKAARQVLGEEFTYNVERFQKSDPTLLRCDEVGRFRLALARPRNVAVAPDGSILVCGDGGVHKFTAAGEQVAAFPLDGPVYSVAVRASGEILAGVPGKIAVIAPAAGEPVFWDGLPANLLPTAIALTPNDVFVADAGNRVVMRLDPSGKIVGLIGKRDPDQGISGFVVPSPYFCVRVAPDGLLRVTNPGEHQIEAYTLDGALEVSWGKASFAVDGFCGCCNPVSFDIFPDGSFVTCEKGLPRVKLYDSHGEFTGVVAGPDAFPHYLKAANAGTPETASAGLYATIDPQGRILVLDVIAGEVRIMQRKQPGHD